MHTAAAAASEQRRCSLSTRECAAADPHSPENEKIEKGVFTEQPLPA